MCIDFFFFNDSAATEIFPLSLHDALPISFRAEVELFQIGWRSGPASLGPTPLRHGPEIADIARVSRVSNLLMSAFVKPGGSASKTVDMPRRLIKQRRVTILESLTSSTFSSD